MENSLKLHKNIFGIDVGNATTVTDTGIILDSKATHIEPLNKCDKLVLDGETYYIGEGEFDTTYRKVEKKIYLPMLYTALALSSDYTYNKIVLGLPLSQFKEDKDKLINFVMRNNNKIIELNNVERKIIIEDIEVFPEGIFTVEDNFEGIVIDIGGRTTDAAMIEIVRNKKKIIEPISLPVGTINLYESFIDTINSKYGLDLKLRDAERILKNGLYIDGNIVNLDFAYEVFKNYTDSLINQLQVKYSLRTNRISVTGGGAELIFDLLKERLGSNVFKQENGILANARNYYELGMNIFM